MSEDTKLSTKYVVVEESPQFEEDEIDLLKIIRYFLLEWKIIFAISTVSVCLAVAYAFHLTEVFKAETLLAHASENKSAASSTLSQFGGLAAMAGVSIPSDSNVEQVIATLKSRKFLKYYIDQKNLKSVLFEDIWNPENKTWLVETETDKPSDQDAIKAFKDIISVDEDKKTGLISLSILWKDPKVAAVWVNDLVKQLNEQLREKAISDSKKRIGYLETELAKTTLQDMRSVLYNLLESEKQMAMLANVNVDFALKVIDPAIAPEHRDKPNRRLIVACGAVCGAFFGIFTVFLFQFFKKLKSSYSPRKVIT